MEVKTINPQLVYFKNFKTTLKNIGQYVGSTPAQMFEEVAKAGGEITGAQVWEYDGADGKPETEFDLTIAVPIKEHVAGLGANTKELAAFDCAVHTHKGSWDELGNAYCEFVGQIMQSGKQPGRVCREIYHQVDFENPANNITEIQMQVQ